MIDINELATFSMCVAHFSVLMGCIASQDSQPRTGHRVYSAMSFESVESRVSEEVELTPHGLLRKDVTNIVQGLRHLNRLEGMIPVACVGENAFPVVLYNFELSNDVTDQIRLPCAAIARYSNGRVFLFGNYSILLHSTLVSTETSAFFENLFSWSAGFRLKTSKIYVLGFPSTISSGIVNDLTGLGYICEGHANIPKTLACDVIICLSNVSYDVARLKHFVEIGGALFVFMGDPQAETPFLMNDFLSELGLAFVDSSLVPSNGSLTVDSVDSLEELTLYSIVDSYCDLLSLGPDLTVKELDWVVGRLRYYVRAMGENKVEEIEALITVSWNYLNSVGYRTVDGICSNDVQCIIAVLITELTTRLPIDRIPVSPCADLFPGLVGKELNMSKSRALRQIVQGGVLMSTGLYLPPGVVAVIESSTNLTIQIGAHTEVLFLKQGPWKRWPLVTMRMEIQKNESTKFASMFGGIVYIICPRSQTVNITCSGLVRYPRYHFQEPAYWDATKIYPVPWTEIDMKDLILTLPTESARRFPDMGQFVKDMIGMANVVWKFLGGRHQGSPQRVVFDVDLPKSDSIVGEVMFTRVDLLEGLVHQNDPTPDLMRLLTLLGLGTMPPNLFDDEGQIAMATVAAYHAMRMRWPSYDPRELLTSAAPRVLYDLWNACEKFGSAPFEKAIKQYMVQKEMSVDETPQELWMLFANELANQAGQELYEIKDRFKQMRKVSADVSNYLASFSLESAD